MKFDENQDGRISIFEFRKLLQTLAKLLSGTFAKKDDIQDIYQTLDTDGDRTINKIEYNQLTKYVKQIMIKNHI